MHLGCESDPFNEDTATSYSSYSEEESDLCGNRTETDVEVFCTNLKVKFWLVLVNMLDEAYFVCSDRAILRRELFSCLPLRFVIAIGVAEATTALRLN